MPFACIHCDTSHWQFYYWSAAAIHIQENDKPVEWTCARSYDRARSTNIFLQRKSIQQHWVKAKIKYVLFSSVYCRHCFRPQRATTTQASLKELTIVPTPWHWAYNFMPAGKVCQSGQQQHWSESLAAHTTVKEWDSFAKAWLVKPAIDHAFALHLGKADKILFTHPLPLTLL